MGGIGSGGSRGTGRATVDESLSLSISHVRSAGALAPGARYFGSSSWRCRGVVTGNISWDTNMRNGAELHLQYQAKPRGGVAEDVSERFVLVATRPHLGGARWWIVCRCGRHTGGLHLPPGASRFRCRHCFRLAYESQREAPEWRAYRRLHKLSDRLSPEWARTLVPADYIDGVEIPPKPKWMRHRTFAKLVARHQVLSGFYQGRAGRALHRLFARLR